MVSALAREMEVPLLMFDLGEDHGRRLRYRDVYPRLVFKAYHDRDLKFKKGIYDVTQISKEDDKMK